MKSVAGRGSAPTADLPEWIRPQLCKLVKEAPDGSDWLHEIKFDGYRMHARLDRGMVQLLTRNGLDWTEKYPAIASAVSSLGARQAYLDGELCGVRPDGTTSFSAIQDASDAGKSDALVFFLFEPAYFAGLDSPAVLFAAGSIVASAVKAAFIRSTSASDISSRLMKELRAAVLTRISSSNLSCMACVSRV